MINEGYHNSTSRERQSYTEKVRQSYSKTVRQNNRVIGAALRRTAMLLCMIIMGIGGAKAEETEIATSYFPQDPGSGNQQIPSSEFADATVGMVFRVYTIETSSDKWIYISNPSNWGAVFGGTTDLYTNTSYYKGTYLF